MDNVPVRSHASLRARRKIAVVSFALVSLTLVLVPGSAPASHSAMPESPGDSGEGPAARFVFPPDGAVLGGDVTLVVEASDTAGILSPVRFYIARGDSDPSNLGHPIGRRPRHRDRHHNHHDDDPSTTETISGPGELVLVEQDFDTSEVHDGDYRISAVLTNVFHHQTRISVTIAIDNRSPRVRIISPRGAREGTRHGRADRDDDMTREEGSGPGGHHRTVTDQVEVAGSVTDQHLASWSLIAKIGEVTIGHLGSGIEPVRAGPLGIYNAAMAPPGYVGPVELVLSASDTAIPVPNYATSVVTIYSDYHLDAYGVLDLNPSYEVSTTIPVMASVTGELGSWRLDVFRAGETDPLITRMGTATGEALQIADFDVAKTYGPGNYVFTLTVIDADGDVSVDTRTVQFIWQPAYLAITYVGPPITGPGPTTALSEFTDPTISGIVEVRGEVVGTNVWAWALGRPIALGEPSFAGEKIVFSSNIDDPFNFDIYQLDLDGTDLIRLTNHPGFDYAPKFSADGALIVFSSTRDYPSGPGAGTDVYLMGGSGTNIERLTADGQSTYPTFSPGATHVALQRPGGIFEIEVSTGATEQLTDGEDYFPAYSPDSSRLIFDRGTRGAQQVFVADLTSPGYPVAQLVSGQTSSGYPQYSPDGTRIVYVTDDVVHIAAADGTGVASLGVSGVDPTFTPDGARIAYATLPTTGPHKIFLIGSDPNNPGIPEELVIPGSSRVPDVSSPQLPFPPAPTANPGGYTPIDIASFVQTPDPLSYWGYLRAPPDQLPTGEMATDSILGYIDADRLPPGVTSLSLTALQCPTEPPPTFDYGLEIPPDAETLSTTAAIGTCNAYSTPQIPLRVLPKTATTELSIDVVRDTPGYSGPLSVPKSFVATGSWSTGDRWAFSAPPYDGLGVPITTRQSGRHFASGPPASDGGAFVPVGDLAALEDLDLTIGDPALGLKVLQGAEISPTPAACGEFFAPGRTGCRYEVDILPGHLGGTTHVTAYSDDRTGLLGAIAWTYTTTAPGNYSPLPGAGGWEAPTSPVQTTMARIVFSGYGRDTAVVAPDLASGP